MNGTLSLPGLPMAKTFLEHFPGYHAAEGKKRGVRPSHQMAVPMYLSSFLLGTLLVLLEFEIPHLSNADWSWGLVHAALFLHQPITEHTDIIQVWS